MFVRAIFIGFVLGLIYAGAYTNAVMDLLVGASPAYMLGDLVQSMEGQVRTSVSSNGTLKEMVGALIIFVFTVASFVVWPMIERAAMSVCALMVKIRQNEGEWQGKEEVK
jgi:hypothetical protein